MENILIIGFSEYGLLAIVLSSLLGIAYVLLYVVGHNSKKELNSDMNSNEKNESEVYLIKNSYPKTESTPQRPDTTGKTRSFYGDKVCDHDRNYEKAALRAYLKGHYYFFYHDKKFRTPELWS